MEYTAKQIENAKRNYNSMLRIHTLADYDVENIGTAEERKGLQSKISKLEWAVYQMKHCC